MKYICKSFQVAAVYTLTQSNTMIKIRKLILRKYYLVIGLHQPFHCYLSGLNPIRVSTLCFNNMSWNLWTEAGSWFVFYSFGFIDFGMFEENWSILIKNSTQFVLWSLLIVQFRLYSVLGKKYHKNENPCIMLTGPWLNLFHYSWC